MTPPVATRHHHHHHHVFGLRVEGKQLLSTQDGSPVILRGCAVSGLEGGIAWGPGHTFWDAPRPDFSKPKAWGMNAIRLPLNQASWLGQTVTNASGTTYTLDAKGYQAEVIACVEEITALGMYTILDLHWSQPGSNAPLGQNAFADTDHSLAFWDSLAATFADNPAVMYELFNEPFLGTSTNGIGPDCFNEPLAVNQVLHSGGGKGVMVQKIGTDGNSDLFSQNWTTTGYQAMLDAVRVVADNVVILGGQQYTNDMTWLVTNPPSDSKKQLVVAFHAYDSGWGYDMTGSSRQFDAPTSIAMLNASGFPVVITEMGGPHDANATATTWDNNMLAIIDAQGWSVMAWTWNNYGNDNTLIKDANFTPTVWGATYKAWLATHAAKTA